MNNDSKEALHIVELQIQNVKRVRAVTIRPDGELVIVGGRNAQGKTSVLDAVEMALGGGKTIPVEPVRRGARKGHVVVDLGEYVVERTFTQKGSTLVVKGKDGAPVKSPQAVLDTLCSTVAFDPLAFSRMEPKKQDAVLKELLGLDFSELDRDREALFAARRDANRDAKALEARLLALPVPEAGTPTEESSVAALAEELQRGREVHQRASEATLQVGAIEAAIEKLGARIGELKQWLRDAEREMEAAITMRSAEAKLTEQLQQEAASCDLRVIAERIRTAETTNAKVRQARERLALETQLRELETRVDDYAAAIEGIDERKTAAIAAAQFPVFGLGFDECGPSFNGLPLEQASGAEKLRVSVAIGAALNPRVKVMLVRDGSLLDRDSLALLAQLAHEQQCQVLLERVGSDDDGAVIIEDGMVLARNNAGEAAQ